MRGELSWVISAEEGIWRNTSQSPWGWNISWADATGSQLPPASVKLLLTHSAKHTWKIIHIPFCTAEICREAAHTYTWQDSITITLYDWEQITYDVFSINNTRTFRVKGLGKEWLQIPLLIPKGLPVFTGNPLFPGHVPRWDSTNPDPLLQQEHWILWGWGI